jgi:hypothetical protein
MGVKETKDQNADADDHSSEERRLDRHCRSPWLGVDKFSGTPGAIHTLPEA